MYDSCKKRKDSENSAKDFINYKDTAMLYKAKNGSLVYYNKSLELTDRQLRTYSDSLSNALENLKIKKPKSITIIKTVFVVDTFTITHTEQLPCDEFTREYNIDSAYYKIDMTLTRDYLRFNSIEIPNKQSIVVGTKKNGFLRRSEYAVTVQNSNPYMQITGIQNYTIKPESKFYQRTWFKLTVGVIGGFFLHQQVSK